MSPSHRIRPLLASGALVLALFSSPVGAQDAAPPALLTTTAVSLQSCQPLSDPFAAPATRPLPSVVVFQPCPVPSPVSDEARATMTTDTTTTRLALPHPEPIALVSCVRAATGEDLLRWATGQPLIPTE